MKQLQFTPLQSATIFKIGQDLSSFLADLLRPHQPQEGDVIAVTSKIFSLAEKQIVARSEISKKDLVRREADRVLAELPYQSTLTLKHGLLLLGAGIDESNSPDGDYILYPQDPWQSAQSLRHDLARTFELCDFGVLMTDSHTIPLRRGVVGISVAHAGFRGTRNKVGEPDLFGRELKFTHQDLPDGLAGGAVFLMGEGNECIPAVLIRGADLEFIEGPDDSNLRVAPEDDIYFPFFEKASR